MVNVSLGHADAVLLVFAVDDRESFEQVAHLRDMVMKSRGPDMPIVIVANKTDKQRELDQIETETVVLMDWENGYVESSAMLNKNIGQIFKELLHQARSEIRLLSGLPKEGLLALSSGNVNMKRRQSLPVVPAFNKTGSDTLNSLHSRRRGSRRGSVAAIIGKESCKVS